SLGIQLFRRTLRLNLINLSSTKFDFHCKFLLFKTLPLRTGSKKLCMDRSGKSSLIHLTFSKVIGCCNETCFAISISCCGCSPRSTHFRIVWFVNQGLHLQTDIESLDFELVSFEIERRS